MSAIWNWFLSAPIPDSSCSSQTVSICCSDNCKSSRQVCPCQNCTQRHKGHILMSYKKFKQNHANVIEEIKCRKKVQDIVLQYNQKIILFMEEFLEIETARLLNEIDKKIFGKNFIEIYKRDLAGKNYYSFIPQFNNSFGQQATVLLQKSIKQKLGKVTDDLKNLMTANRILVEHSLIASIPKMRDDPGQARIEKIKSILPFPCQLTRKFQASKHRFQTNNLHKIGIRGPILLVAQSYKGRVFGGFSTKMFPKDEYYQEDNRCRSFLFSLDMKSILPLKQDYKKFAIKGGNNLWFGRGDLVIADECNKGNISWAQIGRAYHLPTGVSNGADQWMAGSVYFRIVEYEIYQVESSYFGSR